MKKSWDNYLYIPFFLYCPLFNKRRKYNNNDRKYLLAYCNSKVVFEREDVFNLFVENMMEKKITIIIPCYNEIQTIEKVIKKIRKIDIEKQIILVDDNSNDGSRDLIQEKLINYTEQFIKY